MTRNLVYTWEKLSLHAINGTPALKLKQKKTTLYLNQKKIILVYAYSILFIF